MLSVPGFCGSNMQILRENCELYVGRPRGLLICSCAGLLIQTKQLHRRGKYTRTYCPPFAGSLGQPAISTAPPGTFAHSLGRLAFQTSAVGWTNQADRLPWRPYGLIRANIISEDARKNRRISENSFGQRSLSFFSFLLSSFFPSSFLRLLLYRTMAHALSGKNEKT